MLFRSAQSTQNPHLLQDALVPAMFPACLLFSLHPGPGDSEGLRTLRDILRTLSGKETALVSDLTTQRLLTLALSPPHHGVPLVRLRGLAFTAMGALWYQLRDQLGV